MNVEEKLYKLDELTAEADMLCDIMQEILSANEEKIGISKIRYLSEIICQKFREIRALF